MIGIFMIQNFCIHFMFMQQGLNDRDCGLHSPRAPSSLGRGSSTSMEQHTPGNGPHNSGGRSLLQMLVQPRQGQRHEGPTTPGREPTALMQFIGRTTDNVAVIKPRCGQFGDIRDKEAMQTGRSPTEGTGLLPNPGLVPQEEKEEEEVALEDFDSPRGSAENFVDSPSSKLKDDGKGDTSMASNMQLDQDDRGRSRSPTNFKRAIFAGVSSFLNPSNSHLWWKSLLSSPARRLAEEQHLGEPLREGNMVALKLPKAVAPGTAESTEEPHTAGGVKRKTKKTPGRRKDLPKTRATANNMTKPSLRKAISVMKSKKAMQSAMKGVENDYFANSSKVARGAKRHAVKTILETAFPAAMPLTPGKLQALAGALRTSGYKSAHTYLVEAKIFHVEKGWDWTNLLDRHFKLCVKAVRRGLGPAKKAPEVPAEQWKAQPLLPDASKGKSKVKLAAHLFACGVHWMMREIEIAALTSKNVIFEDKNRLVTLVWYESKGDQEGATISRTLQCLCQEACDMSCPYSVLEVLVNHACLQGNEGAALSVCRDGSRATKAQLVGDWRDLFGSSITGHSTRRSGALQYIRDGWSVSQVAFLGRWKSNVILEYAKEALQSIPLNADKALFGASELHQTGQEASDKQSCKPIPSQSNLELIGKLRTEIDSFMNGTKVDTIELTKKVKQLEARFDNYTKFLPSFVVSHRAHVVHRNNKIFLCSPSYMWKTACGWNYYSSDYEFTDDLGTKVTCQKCMTMTSALQQRGKVADVLDS